MTSFVFFHVGTDTSQPRMLTESILRRNKDANVIQCSDHLTAVVDGVSKIYRLNGNLNHLMSFRLKAFSEIKLEDPAIYLDTDMLVTKKIDPAKLLKKNEVMLCRRAFNRNAIFNPIQRGLNFEEYSNSSLDSVYPFLACTTVTKNWKFWSRLLEILELKEEKFLRWYGDQEAMRDWHSQNKTTKVGYLSESEFGCLPEFHDLIDKARILHFKGPKRKELMAEFFKSI
jgi:hypothetical protein